MTGCMVLKPDQRARLQRRTNVTRTPAVRDEEAGSRLSVAHVQDASMVVAAANLRSCSWPSNPRLMLRAGRLSAKGQHATRRVILYQSRIIYRNYRV